MSRVEEASSLALTGSEDRFTTNESEFVIEDDEGYENGKAEDEEDLLGRFEYEIQESVAEFVDELPTDCNMIPDTDVEDEDAFVVRNRRISSRSDDRLALGASFYTGFEFKEAVLDYVLRSGMNIVQDRWDSNKISYKCGIGGTCKWRVYCSYDKSAQKWLVKTRYGYHSCTPNGKCKLLKSPVIGRLLMDKLRDNVDLMPEKIQKMIKDTWKFVSTRNQCQRGRLLALKWLEKEYANQLSHMRGYVQEILSSNPGSTCFVETVSNATGEDVFDKFYVCFNEIKRNWRGYCRPIIGLDGTFLKAAVKGVILVAVGHDANNQIYPIAWAVVQSENADNWLWFVKQLKSDLVMANGDGYVVISDRSKGLISAVKDELPQVEHRMCVKHIIENFKKRHKQKDLLKPLIWGLAWSYNESDYDRNLRKIRDYNHSLYADVLKENPKTWCRAFYKIGTCCENVDNNSTESFNSTITKARAKALLPMLETIRIQTMQRISKRNLKSQNHEGLISKYASKILLQHKEDAEKCQTFTSTKDKYEVHLKGNSYTVNLRKKTCSCQKYQIIGIPCEHAYGAILDRGFPADEHVSQFFSTFLWQELYSSNIRPVRGPRFWMKNDYQLIVPPPEPVLPGRKKKKKTSQRIRGKHESPKKKKNSQIEKLGRQGRIVHCSTCSQPGHNAAGCHVHPRKKMKTAEGESSSQVVDTILLSQTTQTSNI